METEWASVLPWAYPLDDFYAQAGLPLPDIEQIQGDQMPEPYRSLLVHQNDMTPTLEEFYQSTIHIRAINRNQRGNFYFREVVLLLENSDKPVEFGAIKINLDLLEPPVRQMILAEREPLGHILAVSSVVHTSRPKAYLKLMSDEFIGGALQIDKPCVLYGRRNTLFDQANRSLAEIVEILPPARNGDLQT